MKISNLLNKGKAVLGKEINLPNPFKKAPKPPLIVDKTSKTGVNALLNKQRVRKVNSNKFQYKRSSVIDSAKYAKDRIDNARAASMVNPMENSMLGGRKSHRLTKTPTTFNKTGNVRSR